MTFPCIDPDHFEVLTDGSIRPQPWMQQRIVATVSAESQSKSYAVTGGGDKDDLIHSIKTNWLNDTPLAHNVYGLVTRGGCRVTLQARSRGYIVQWHNFHIDSPPSALFPVSSFGVGGDLGKGGLLAIGTGFCVMRVQMHSTTIPLLPVVAGMTRIDPGHRFYGQVDVRFTTEFWENTTIDGGDQETESSWESGDTRLDLVAIPIIE